MISASDFRNGMTIEIDGNVCQIIEFQHVKPGKGAAFVRTKLKDIINGGVKETTFRPTEKFPAARIDRKDMQFFIRMEIFSTSWIQRPMSRLVLHPSRLEMLLSLLRRMRFARSILTTVTYLV